MLHVLHKFNTQAQNINTRVGLSGRYVPDISDHEVKGHSECLLNSPSGVSDMGSLLLQVETLLCSTF